MTYMNINPYKGLRKFIICMPGSDDKLDFLKSLLDFLKFLIFPIISMVIISLLVTFNIIDQVIGTLIGFFIITTLFILYYLKQKRKQEKTTQKYQKRRF